MNGSGFPGEKIFRLEDRRSANGAPPRPIVFVLPGLGGEEDPALENFWGPLRSTLDLVPVSYMDWTGIIKSGSDFNVLAGHVRRQIEERSPAGPIRMAGYSIGGHLAYATAVALESEGRRVESVVILDAPVSVSDFTPSFRRRAIARLKWLMSLNLRDALASVFAKTLTRDSMRPALHRLSRYRDMKLPFHFDEHLHHKITMQLVQRIYPEWWNHTLRQASQLAGSARLFRSQEHETIELDDLGWAAYCRNLEVIPVAGSHRGMLDSAINGPMRAAFVEAMTAAHT